MSKSIKGEQGLTFLELIIALGVGWVLFKIVIGWIV